MSPEVLLLLARDILDRPEFGIEGVWPRTAAFLGRQSLESALDQQWEASLPQMRYATRATQLACIDQFVKDAVVVDGVRTAWSALSRVCHHHPYELSPTAAELEMWLAKVDGLVNELEPTVG